VTIGPVSLPVAPVTPTAPAAAATPSSATGATSGTDFAKVLEGGLDHLQQVQSTADDLALQAATGQLKDPHDYLIASTQASLATELTVAVRNKAVEAFNEIMRMPV
jgi:flagellar hook-basal body complex protein FliE